MRSEHANFLATFAKVSSIIPPTRINVKAGLALKEIHNQRCHHQKAIATHRSTGERKKVFTLRCDFYLSGNVYVRFGYEERNSPELGGQFSA